MRRWWGVAVVALAPAAVRILPLLEPCHRALYRRIVRPDPRLRQRPEHGPGAVNIIRAPTAEPRAVGLLLLAQIGNSTIQRRLILGAAHACEHRDNPRGH